jgi:hypothetical protein
LERDNHFWSRYPFPTVPLQPKERFTKRRDKRKKALREQAKRKKAKTTPGGGGPSSAQSTTKKSIPRSLVARETSSKSDTSDDESESDSSAVEMDLDDWKPINGKKKKSASMSKLNERISKLAEGAKVMKTTAANLVALMEQTQEGIGANSGRILEVHKAAVSASKRISEPQWLQMRPRHIVVALSKLEGSTEHARFHCRPQRGVRVARFGN